jgi:diguanylate cyclase (GGDEF) domain
MILFGAVTIVRNLIKNNYLGTEDFKWISCIRQQKHYGKQEYKLLKNTYCDSITGFPSINRLKDQLNNHEYNKYRSGTFLLVTLNNLRFINGVYGYELGNEVVNEVGKSLNKTIIREKQICKYKDDEFGILMSNLVDLNEIVIICRNVINVLQKSIFIGNIDICLNINIGVALYPKDGLDLMTVLRNADAALHKFTKLGSNRYTFYYNNLHDEMLRKMSVENRLRHAISKSELEVYYQPQVDIESDKIKKFEALMRWHNKELGQISPVEFIPIAEETGLINVLGHWILREVCSQLREWTRRGYFYVVSVNVSQAQIQNEHYIDTVINLLQEFKIPPNLIEIEITESIIMSSFEANIQTLKVMKNMGMGITLDDFGTGYSSLSYLKTLPIKSVKIDKSFVDDIVYNRISRDIISGIIALAKNLELNVIVEGVEKEEQIELLRTMGCTIVQGYYYSKPIPAEIVESEFLCC